MGQLCGGGNVADRRWAGHGGFLLFCFDWLCLVCPSIWICVEKNGERQVTKALSRRSAPNVSTHRQMQLGIGKVFGGLFVKNNTFLSDFFA